MNTSIKTEQRINPVRQYDIDWLRVLAMVMVFLFHCARFFDHDDWHVKNLQLDAGMSSFVFFVSRWIMPLFFMLSAISASFSLSRRSGRQFIVSRIKRLAVPFIIGALTHISLQVYFERVSHSHFEGSFFAFFPQYFNGLYAFGGNFAWMGLHLWYLEVLFIFSLIVLPLFLVLKKPSLEGFRQNLTVFFTKPGAVFLLAVPLMAMEIIVGLDPDGIGRRDFGGWSLLTYLVFFVNGYLLVLGDRERQAVKKHGWIAFGLGIITTSVGILMIESGRSYNGILVAFLQAFNSWFWLVAILGLGNRFLRSKNRFLSYANEAVLPFYVLHQTIIVTIAFFMISWQAGVWVKYIVLAVSSFTGIVILYDLLVRRFNPIRFLFGMRSKS
ncbi:MAG: acyltransferase [Candidatus Aminicenantaceae bacterium]